MDASGTDPVVARLRDMFRDTLEPVVVSERGTLRVATPASVRLLGFAREEELLGRPFLDLVDAADHARWMEYITRRPPEGGLVQSSCTARAIRGDGSPVDLEIRATGLALDGRPFTHVSLRAAGADTDVARLFDAFFVRNTTVKLLIDPANGRIVDANDAAARFYGWSLPELRRMWMSQINTLRAEDVARLMARARDGHQRYFRFEHRVADGTLRDVEVHTGPVEIGGRSLLMSIVVDLTERRALEDRLRQAEQLEAIGRLAGGIAHDFNNLLTIVVGCAELARPHLASDGRRHLEDLLGAAHRASVLTHRLLAVGRRQQLLARPVRLDEVVRGAEPLLLRAVGPEVALELRLDRGGLVVEADPSQLEQVLLNLVLNAAEAMDQRGTVTLELGPGEDEAFGSPFAVLRVIDHGRGMDEATRRRVFEPFFTTKGGQGTGLGLASVHGVVSQSGGHVEVTSELGRGTTFSVWLPVRGAGSPAAEPPPSAKAPGGGRLVWVVDDEDDLRELLAETLERAGFRVAGFASAEGALAASGFEEVAALLTDQVMPGRSGVELARALRARRPTLPVLLVSGDPVFAASVANDPGWSFLQKPFSSVELARRIAELIAG